MDIQRIRKNIDDYGFAIVPNRLDYEQLVELSKLSRRYVEHCPKAGIRGILNQSAAIRKQPIFSKMQNLATRIIGTNARPVRSLLFNKNKKLNWNVGWHQDITIAVEKKIETLGFTGWSTKHNIPHVHPPESILQQMLSIRLHLDPATESNGALWVSPGTHGLGRIEINQAVALTEKHGKVLCSAEAGDLLLFRPLLLHASCKIQSTSQRRVFHIEFSACDLPETLDWHHAV